jgi:ABC-type transporter Mla MlaB component
MAVPGLHTVDFALHGPLDRADLPGLCDCVDVLLSESGADVVLCDVHGVEPDALTVEALCRLQVAARRHGCKVRLRGASDELLQLVAFMGLTDVFAD